MEMGFDLFEPAHVDDRVNAYFLQFLELLKINRDVA